MPISSLTWFWNEQSLLPLELLVSRFLSPATQPAWFVDPHFLAVSRSRKDIRISYLDNPDDKHQSYISIMIPLWRLPTCHSTHWHDPCSLSRLLAPKNGVLRSFWEEWNHLRILTTLRPSLYGKGNPKLQSKSHRYIDPSLEVFSDDPNCFKVIYRIMLTPD